MVTWMEECMPAATFTPVDDVVSQATSAGFFPGRHAVDVTDVRRLSDGVFRLTFRDGYIAAHAKAAQFVNLFSHDSMMLMPRPFGVSEVRDDLVSVIFAVVGKGTQEFSRLHAGDRIDVLGPPPVQHETRRTLSAGWRRPGRAAADLCRATVAGVGKVTLDRGVRLQERAFRR